MKKIYLPTTTDVWQYPHAILSTKCLPVNGLQKVLLRLSKIYSLQLTVFMSLRLLL